MSTVLVALDSTVSPCICRARPRGGCYHLDGPGISQNLCWKLGSQVTMLSDETFKRSSLVAGG